MSEQQQWETIYADDVIHLKRNKRSGAYSLFDTNTESLFVIPRDEPEPLQRWETLYEDEVLRLRHHATIEPLYVIINKLSGALVIIITDERKRLGHVIPIPGGLEE